MIFFCRKTGRFLKSKMPNQQNGGSYSLIVVTSVTSLGLLTSLICLLYILIKLTLNKIIKAIFCIMAFNNIIALLLMTVSTSVMIAYNSRTWYTCMVFIQPLLLLIWSNWILASLISMIRVHS